MAIDLYSALVSVPVKPVVCKPMTVFVVLPRTCFVKCLKLFAWIRDEPIDNIGFWTPVLCPGVFPFPLFNIYNLLAMEVPLFAGYSLYIWLWKTLRMGIIIWFIGLFASFAQIAVSWQPTTPLPNFSSIFGYSFIHIAFPRYVTTSWGTFLGQRGTAFYTDTSSPSPESETQRDTLTTGSIRSQRYRSSFCPTRTFTKPALSTEFPFLPLPLPYFIPSLIFQWQVLVTPWHSNILSSTLSIDNIQCHRALYNPLSSDAWWRVRVLGVQHPKVRPLQLKTR